jgi:protein TonB
MNGYKTGGDWTDVTSIGRNEVVFEGRHKAYGAFYIRKRYPNALLFAFLLAFTFIALCAFIPYALRNAGRVIPKPAKDVVIKPTDVLIHTDIIMPHITRPVVKTPKTNTPNRIPVINPRHDDSVPQPIVDNHEPINPGGNPTPGDPHGPDVPVPNSGPGNPLPSPPDNTIRTWVSEMPKFPGGNVEDYLGKQIRYSAEDVQLGIQGTVFVSFVIEKDGSVSGVKMLSGVANGPDLNNEALRVIAEMPKWTPGKQDGHPVRIQYMIPIHFKLQ